MGLIGYLTLLALLDATSGHNHISHVHLYGADPRGGLWEAKVNIGMLFEHDHAEGNDTAITAALTADRFSIIEEGIDITTYDHATKSVLFKTSHDASSGLYFGPLCQKKSPAKFLTDLEVVPLNDEQLGDCVNCETSAFSLHEGKLYFLLFGEFFSTDTISRLVQIRVFEACGRCGMTSKENYSDFPFQDMVKCSNVVTEVLREQFAFTAYDSMQVKAGKGMKVTQHGDHLNFFFLLANITEFDEGHDKVTLTLWHADNRGHSKQLHTEEMLPEFSAWNSRGLGSLDYVHHDICWSAGDRILCAEFSDHHMHHQEVLVTAKEAATSGVCQGVAEEYIRLSGVAISRSDEKKVVFFGCHPSDPERGGVGLVHVSEGVKHIRPLRTESESLLAGSLFAVKDHVKDHSDCPSSLDLEICLGQGQMATDDNPRGHLHLDLTELEDAFSEDGDYDQLNSDTKTDTETSKTDFEPPKTDTEASKTDTEVSKTETEASKTDTEVSITETEASKTDTEHKGHSNDDMSDTDDDYDDTDDRDIDDFYDNNEMSVDQDYKYIYKTQELVMEGIGGAGTIRGQCFVIITLVTAILFM